VENKAEEDLKF